MRLRKDLLRRIYVLLFQLWRLVFLEPPGVLRHIIPHFKGLISADWNLKSSRAWQHFYLLPCPFEKGRFRGKMAKRPRMILSSCTYFLAMKNICNNILEKMKQIMDKDQICSLHLLREKTLVWLEHNAYIVKGKLDSDVLKLDSLINIVTHLSIT